LIEDLPLLILQSSLDRLGLDAALAFDPNLDDPVGVWGQVRPGGDAPVRVRQTGARERLGGNRPARVRRAGGLSLH